MPSVLSVLSVRIIKKDLAMTVDEELDVNSIEEIGDGRRYGGFSCPGTDQASQSSLRTLLDMS